MQRVRTHSRCCAAQSAIYPLRHLITMRVSEKFLGFERAAADLVGSGAIAECLVDHYEEVLNQILWCRNGEFGCFEGPDNYVGLTRHWNALILQKLNNMNRKGKPVRIPEVPDNFGDYIESWNALFETIDASGMDFDEREELYKSFVLPIKT